VGVPTSAPSWVQMDGEDDHVHLLVAYPPRRGRPAGELLKGVSARRLRQRYWVRTHREHLWSPSYVAASAGGAPLETLRAYIRQQRTLGRPRATQCSRTYRSNPRRRSRGQHQSLEHYGQVVGDQSAAELSKDRPSRGIRPCVLPQAPTSPVGLDRSNGPAPMAGGSP
jgi:putative transposase